MKPYGLTGNIGCGKSTVATLLSSFPDVFVFDCDRISKEIIGSGTYNQNINEILGADVFAHNRVHFKEIAKIIFEDTHKKKLLEELLHPLVWALVDERVSQVHIDTKGNCICVVESAIIFETHCLDKFASVIVAVCNPREQHRRLRTIRHMNDEQIQARQNQQLPQEEKERQAQFVIHTDCNPNQLTERVTELYKQLKQQKGALV
jgi:dephospho-CoA kinase